MHKWHSQRKQVILCVYLVTFVRNAYTTLKNLTLLNLKVLLVIKIGESCESKEDHSVIISQNKATVKNDDNKSVQACLRMLMAVASMKKCNCKW